MQWRRDQREKRLRLGGGLKAERKLKGESGASAVIHSATLRERRGSNPKSCSRSGSRVLSMALSAGLEKNGTPPTKVETTAACTVQAVPGGFGITTMKLNVQATVPNIDKNKFDQIAKETKEGCPVSKALKGNVDIQLEARLL